MSNAQALPRVLSFDPMVNDYAAVNECAEIAALHLYLAFLEKQSKWLCSTAVHVTILARVAKKFTRFQNAINEFLKMHSKNVLSFQYQDARRLDTNLSLAGVARQKAVCR